MKIGSAFIAGVIIACTVTSSCGAEGEINDPPTAPPLAPYTGDPTPPSPSHATTPTSEWDRDSTDIPPPSESPRKR